MPAPVTQDPAQTSSVRTWGVTELWCPFQGMAPRALSSRRTYVPLFYSRVPSLSLLWLPCQLLSTISASPNRPPAATLGSLPFLGCARQPPILQLYSQLAPLRPAPSLTSLEVTPNLKLPAMYPTSGSPQASGARHLLWHSPACATNTPISPQLSPRALEFFLLVNASRVPRIVPGMG